MTLAYATGLSLGALFSAFAVSRVLLWLFRHWQTDSSRVLVANGLSFVVIVGISILVRGGFEWPAALMHLIAQAIWLGFDLWRPTRAPD